MSEKTKAINTLDRVNNQLNELFNRVYQVDEGLLHKRVGPKSLNVIQVLEQLHETELLTLQYMKYKVKQKTAFSKEGFQAKVKYFVMRVLYSLPLKFKAPRYSVSRMMNWFQRDAEEICRSSEGLSAVHRCTRRIFLSASSL